MERVSRLASKTSRPWALDERVEAPAAATEAGTGLTTGTDKFVAASGCTADATGVRAAVEPCVASVPPTVVSLRVSAAADISVA